MDWAVDGEEETWSDEEEDKSKSEMSISEILALLISRDLLPNEDTKKLLLKSLEATESSPDSTLARLYFDDISSPPTKLLTYSLMTYVSNKEYLKISELLRLSPVEVNKLHADDGELAVHKATTVEALKRLREGNADLFLESSDGNSPLSLALRSGNSRMASYILSFVEDTTRWINMPSQKRSGYLEIMEYFYAIFNKHNVENEELSTTLRLFKMSLTSLSRFGLRASNEDRETALKFLTEIMNAHENSESALFDAIYDQYPADHANVFKEIIETLLSETPGIFHEPDMAECKDNPNSSANNIDSSPTSENNLKISNQRNEIVERNFEHLDHTADIQIHSWGRTLEEAFESAVLGMFDYSVPLEKVEARKMILVDSRAKKNSDLKDILFLVMQDSLYEAATDPYFMAREAKIISLNRENCTCKMQLKGEEFDLRKHGGFGTEVKAVTHSALNIIETKEKSEVWVIVDI